MKLLVPGVVRRVVRAMSWIRGGGGAPLRLAGKGLDAPHIAVHLSLGEGTVRNYLSSAIAKTGSRNRVEAARTAESNGWL